MRKKIGKAGIPLRSDELRRTRTGLEYAYANLPMDASEDTGYGAQARDYYINSK